MKLIRRIRNIRNFLNIGEIDDYLERFSRIDQLDTNRYRIETYHSFFPGYRRGIFRDTRLGFELVLVHFPEDLVLACVGYTLGLNGTVTIKQIQGKKDSDGSLATLKWERMLLEIVINQAGKSGFQEVRVQKAEDNRWWPRVSEPTRERLRFRYDATAKRRGFRYDNGSGFYVLDLNGSFK
jgi:hypothetical protein